MKESRLIKAERVIRAVETLMSYSVSHPKLGEVIQNVVEKIKDYYAASTLEPTVTVDKCFECGSVIMPHLVEGDVNGSSFTLVCSNPKCDYELKVWEE